MIKNSRICHFLEKFKKFSPFLDFFKLKGQRLNLQKRCFQTHIKKTSQTNLDQSLGFWM